MAKNKLKDTVRPVYSCTSCGKRREREELTVKKALFQMFGRNGKWLRSRVVAWLCEDCRDLDPDWNLTDKKGGRPVAPSEDS